MLNGSPLLERAVSDRFQAHPVATAGSSPSRTNSSRNVTGSSVSAVTLSEELKQQKEWKNAIVFLEDGTVLASTFTPRKEEITAWTKLFLRREDTIASGIILSNEQYDVHRYHPPLIYGRRGDALNEQTEGIAICKLERPTKQPIYCLITYSHPTLSARAVPQLRDFCQTCTKFNNSFTNSSNCVICKS
ncbi:unnamed protein product [Albugo candida]|uniref:Profilin n=1 Tax=Albugo candida TaxID=65357 RepID=A0A024GLK9_9STRA|nr:unnamed protein product [Albugo candida]|eukprot:CCI47385.1 unnamed protein product [Albugo candida]